MKIKTSKECFVDIFNEQSGLGHSDTFTVDDLVFRDKRRLPNGQFAVWTCAKDSLDNCVQVNFEEIDIRDILGVDFLILDIVGTDIADVRAAILEKYHWDVGIDDWLIVKLSEDQLGSKWDIYPTKENLIYTGSMEIVVRPLNELLNKSVRTHLDIHEYFSTNKDATKPDIQVVFKLKAPTKGFDLLFKGLKPNDIIDLGSPIIHLAKDLTNDDWVTYPAVRTFNLYHSTVVYNGLNTGKYFTGSKQHSHVLVLRIGDYCSNLKGLWIIPYFSKGWNVTYPFAIRGNVVLDED